MRIRELAQRAGATPKAVRYYESLGLLSVERRSNGYRDYGESQVELVREIRALGRLGITADETRPFLDCLVAGRSRGDDCPASLDAYRDTIDSLGSRIDELSARRSELIALLDRAGNRPEPLCEFGAAAAASEIGHTTDEGRILHDRNN